MFERITLNQPFRFGLGEYGLHRVKEMVTSLVATAEVNKEPLDTRPGHLVYTHVAQRGEDVVYEHLPF